MSEQDVKRLVARLNRLSAETERHRAAISGIATERRALAGELSELVGPTRAAQLLNISRQVFWQILNPERSRQIKKKSMGARREPS